MERLFTSFTNAGATATQNKNIMQTGYYAGEREDLMAKEGRGGRRYLPYVFTEQGIAMLSAVLRSDIAIQVSIRIMETFVEMRKYMANTSLLYDRMNAIEISKQW